MSVRRYLVDTHIVIWAMEGNERLSEKYREIVANGSSLYVSIISLWEIAIKTSIKKLEIRADVAEVLRDYNIEILPITVAHVNTFMMLPHHHRDPFDRMLIAQAMSEKLQILTVDRNFPLYDIVVA
jgi:PIN domain nuclease of toxin-antitoxin system